MTELKLDLGAQPNTHTVMKLNTIESDLKLHLAKKGNHTHTKEPSQNFKDQQHTCIRVIVTGPKWSEDHSIIFAVRGHSEQL